MGVAMSLGRSFQRRWAPTLALQFMTAVLLLAPAGAAHGGTTRERTISHEFRVAASWVERVDECLEIAKTIIADTVLITYEEYTVNICGPGLLKEVYGAVETAESMITAASNNRSAHVVAELLLFTKAGE